MATPLHLALTPLDGTADLVCPRYDTVVRNRAIRFDPVELVFTVQLLATEPLVEDLANEHDAIEFQLSNVVLSHADLGVHLEAEYLDGLFRQNALSEWPESIGINQSSGFKVEGSITRRLLLGPEEREIIFTARELLDVERPYKVFYSNACDSLCPPADLFLERRATPVRFEPKFPTQGFICAFASIDFFAEEERIRAALQLIHGRHLPTALMVLGRQITFYGHRTAKRSNYLPLVEDDHDANHLTDAVLAAFAVMPPVQFEKIRYALSFFRLGKEADVPVEAKYLLLMACVEAMDDRQSLQTDSTSRMLGISSDAAKLVNGMRHQLTHGKGGYQQAFDAVIAEQFSNAKPVLESALKACISEEGQLDFAVLWLRVCERIDAFWCAWLGISDSLAAQRYSPVSLMPLPIDVRLLAKSAAAPDSNETQLQIKALNRKTTALKQRICELDAELAKQGKQYAQLKLEHAACSKPNFESPSNRTLG